MSMNTIFEVILYKSMYFQYIVELFFIRPFTLPLYILAPR